MRVKFRSETLAIGSFGHPAGFFVLMALTLSQSVTLLPCLCGAILILGLSDRLSRALPSAIYYTLPLLFPRLNGPPATIRADP